MRATTAMTVTNPRHTTTASLAVRSSSGPWSVTVCLRGAVRAPMPGLPDDGTDGEVPADRAQGGSSIGPAPGPAGGRWSRPAPAADRAGDRGPAQAVDRSANP